MAKAKCDRLVRKPLERRISSIDVRRCCPISSRASVGKRAAMTRLVLCTAGIKASRSSLWLVSRCHSHKRISSPRIWSAASGVLSVPDSERWRYCMSSETD